MTEILLHAFFQALRAERLVVGIRDIGRMRTLFSTQRDWTLSAIQDSLRALLAHEPAQRATFDRVFRQFFLESRSGEPVESLDLARALKDLQAVPKQTPIPVPVPDQPLRPQPTPPRLRRTWLRRHWKAISAALALLVAVGVWWRLTSKPSVENTSTLRLEPATLDFGSVPVVSNTRQYRPGMLVGRPNDEKQLTLINISTTQSAKITSLEIAGDYRDFQKSGWDGLVGRSLAPGEKVTLNVLCTPQRADDLRGAVVVNAVSNWPPVQTVMQATGTGTETEQPVFAHIPRPTNVSEPPFSVPEGTPNSIRAELAPLVRSRAAQYWWAASVISFGLLALLSVYVYRWRKPRQEAPPVSRENEPGERFSFASVGGPPAPLLLAQQAKRLGDTLDFVRTDTLSSRLDAPGSVAATIRAGGIPRLRFQPLVALRSVIVLEDGWTHRDFRSAIVDQLCDELQDTGVTCTRYQFRGSAETLIGERGQSLDLSELARERDTQAVLLFTDGSSFSNPRGQESLAQLAEWPRIAWLELREASRRAAHGLGQQEPMLPVFPATPAGLQAAFDQFAVPGLQGSNSKSQISNLKFEISNFRSVPPTRSQAPNLETYLEATLGQALLWAADCQFVQPCSLGLADALRREFHPDVVAEEIQRINALDGVERDAAGFTFDPPTFRVLRRAWLARRSAKDQQLVLEFIRETLLAAKPVALPESVALQTWEAAVDLVGLELDPNDNRHLAQLANSPVGRYVSSRLGYLSVNADDPQKGPLRRPPTEPHACQRLAAMSPEIGIPRLKALPPRPWHWVGLAASSSAGLLCAVLAVFQQQPQPTGFVAPMNLQWIQPGTFSMGSPLNESGRISDETEHQVRLTQPFFLAATEVTQRQYEEIMGENPSHFTEVGPEAPVERVSWHNAVDYCRRLTEREHKSGRLPADWEFRLPTEAQWEYACRAGTTTRFSFGDQITLKEANYSGVEDNFGGRDEAAIGESAPVGKYAANPWGMYDMHGNVFEWCADGYGDYSEGSATDPQGAASAANRVIRGGSCFSVVSECRAAVRGGQGPSGRFTNLGFRVAAVQSGKPVPAPSSRKFENNLSNSDLAAEQLKPEITSVIHHFLANKEMSIDTVKSATIEQFWGRLNETELITFVDQVIAASTSNSAVKSWRNIKLVFVPPGEFLMGSPSNEHERDEDEIQHRVRHTQGFYLSKYEVTQALYQDIMSENPSRFTDVGLDAPVENVSWENAMDFCRRLTDRDQKTGALPTGHVYSLPTEAQWEYACRAGTQSAFSFGETITIKDVNFGRDDKFAEIQGARGKTAPVGSYRPNAWGLYDMHGNVWEWCRDWYGVYATDSVVDPQGAAPASLRVFRGGSWFLDARLCRAADRSALLPVFRSDNLSFRVAAVLSSPEKLTEPDAKPRDEGERVILK